MVVVTKSQAENLGLQLAGSIREVPAVIYEIVENLSENEDQQELVRAPRMLYIDYDPREFDEHHEEIHQTKEVVLVKKQRPKSMIKMSLKDVLL